MDEGDPSPPGGISEIAASIRRMLTLRAGLKPRDFMVLLLEKTSDELERMK